MIRYWSWVLYPVLGLIALIFQSSAFAEISGYKLIKSEFISDIASTVRIYKHLKSGSTVLKIENSDDNKTFGIAFRTLPQDDTGIAHIVEHMTLQGAQKYPVKNLFNQLLTSTYNSYLDATTWEDRTVYPVASRNESEFRNLMDFYLQMVFFPTFLKERMIFLQEGWRLEPSVGGEQFNYNGVVYNEMKGRNADPYSRMYYMIGRELLRPSPWSTASGGDPDVIPLLKYDAAVDFYKKYYHPDNSLIYIYGNGNTEKELKLIADEALERFTARKSVITLPKARRWSGPKKIKDYYPIGKGEDPSGKSSISLTFLQPPGFDNKSCGLFALLGSYLVGSSSSPLRTELKDAGIAKDAGYWASCNTASYFSVYVSNGKDGDDKRLRQTVLKFLKKSVEHGFDRSILESQMNLYELGLREQRSGGAYRGIDYLHSSVQGWLYAGDPMLTLRSDETIASMRQALKGRFFEDFVAKRFLSEKNMLLAEMQPKPGMGEEIEKRRGDQANLAAKRLGPSGIESIKADQKLLLEYGKKTSSTDAITALPHIKPSDIKAEAEEFPVTETVSHGATILYHPQNIDQVIYLRIGFNANILPLEDLPYLRLFSMLLASLDTQKYGHLELLKEVNSNSGGLYTPMSISGLTYDGETNFVKQLIQTRALTSKFSKVVELVDEIIQKTKFSDKKRIKQLLDTHHANLINSARSGERWYASQCLESQLSSLGIRTEKVYGLSYTVFVDNIVKNFDRESDAFVAKMESLRQKLISRQGLIVAFSSNAASKVIADKVLEDFIKKLPDGPKAPEFLPSLPPNSRRGQAIPAPSQVSHLYYGGNYKELGYPYSGSMDVLSALLRKRYLWPKIREAGGAYGAGVVFNFEGSVVLNTYRDPHIKESIETLRKSGEAFASTPISDDELSGVIVNVLSDRDAPISSENRIDRVFYYYVEKRSFTLRQRERSEILATKSEDIIKGAKILDETLKRGSYCVIGDELEIARQKEFFQEVVSPPKG